MKHMQAPCNGCPFSRTVTPGALGGSSPETFIGQAFGPFLLPCHKTHTRDMYKTDEEFRTQAAHKSQCAGAAIFRANMGLSALMPEGIHKLPQDMDAVFSNPVEFYVHHKRTTVFDAVSQLLRRTPRDLLAEQLARQSNVLFNKKDI